MLDQGWCGYNEQWRSIGDTKLDWERLRVVELREGMQGTELCQEQAERHNCPMRLTTSIA